MKFIVFDAWCNETETFSPIAVRPEHIRSVDTYTKDNIPGGQSEIEMDYMDEGNTELFYYVSTARLERIVAAIEKHDGAKIVWVEE